MSIGVKVGPMRYRPVSWPVVSGGVAAIGIGAVGLLFYSFSAGSPSTLLPLTSVAIAATGVVAVLVGWFYDPSE